MSKMIKNKKIPKNYYDENYIYIKDFLKINLTDICKKLKYNRPTISSGNGTIEQYQNIRKEIEKQVAKLYIK